MKSITFVIVLIPLLSGIFFSAFAQQDSLSWNYVINQQWTKPAKLDSFINVHPRYLLTAERVANIKTRVKIPGTIQQYLWENVLKPKADRLLTQNPPGGSNEDNMRNSGRGLPWLALAYLIADEPDKTNYLNKAKKWVTIVCNWSNWNRNTSLGAAEGLMGVAIAYDWIYDKFTTSERDHIKSKLILQANRMKDGPPQHFDRYLANHNHVEHNGLAAAGFVLYDEVSEAIDWLKQADLVFQTTFLVGSNDGSSTEGHQYWGYSMESLLCFTEAAKDLMDKDYYDRPWIKAASDFIIFSTLPDFNMLPNNENFGNCVMSFGDSHRDYRSHGPTHILCRLASEYKNGYAQWLAEQMIERGVGLTEIDYRAWANLVWYDETVPATSLTSLPTFKHFDDIGWVTMRNGWIDDAVLVGFKCGPFHGHKLHPYYEKQVDEGWSSYHTIVNGHGHPDVNSFQIYAYGKWLATEPGYSKPKWTRDHCTILANNLGQLGEGSNWFDREEVVAAKAKSNIIKTENTSQFDYVIGDAGNIYRDLNLIKFYRHLIYIKPDFIIIADELEANPYANYFEWRLRTKHKRAEFVDNMNIAKQTENYYIIENNTDSDVVVMDVHFVHPELENFSTTTEANEFLITHFNSTGSDLLVTIIHPRRKNSLPDSVYMVSYQDSLIDLEILVDDEKTSVTIDFINQNVNISTSTVGVKQGKSHFAKPKIFELFQNYPNPFNPLTTIRYSIPKFDRVNLKIYNLFGQEIKTLVNDEQPAGKYMICWNGRNEKGFQVADGIYLYQLNAGNFRSSKKMTLMR